MTVRDVLASKELAFQSGKSHVNEYKICHVVRLASKNLNGVRETESERGRTGCGGSSLYIATFENLKEGNKHGDLDPAFGNSGAGSGTAEYETRYGPP